ncbi:hypothetical protein E4U42_000945 [Claviceps africana]|uniref:Uncharacterized protein n=1 Tax=Claviceps africana TaxID=83212 RepID=A0A8K0NJH0_9HYPO|nr:hypothetical protein E4U42_000945 [Claviceps africana]
MPSNHSPTALPLATNRAALSNKISLLLSQRTSLLGSLTGSSTGADAKGDTPRQGLRDDDDDDRLSSRPNDGVGYVRAAAEAKPGDEALRRLLGKRKKGSAAARRVCESESDSDEGRGSLGRAKRARRHGDATQGGKGVEEGGRVVMDSRGSPRGGVSAAGDGIGPDTTRTV